MSNEQKLLAEWKERLGLQNWVIQLKVNCEKDELNPEMCGEVEYVAVNKTAVVRILSEKHYGDRVAKYDFEKAMVHELLHLSMWQIYNMEDIQDRIVHPMIDDLARALVMAKRGETKRA